MPTIRLIEGHAIEVQDSVGTDEVYFPVGTARANWSGEDRKVQSVSTRFDYGKACYRFNKGQTRTFDLTLLDNVDRGQGAIVVFAAWEADTSTDDTRKELQETLGKMAEAAATRVPSALESMRTGERGPSQSGGKGDTATLVPLPAAVISAALPNLLEALNRLGEAGVNLGKLIQSMKAFFGSADDFLGAVQFAMYRDGNKVDWAYTPLEGCDAGTRSADVLTVNFTGGKGGKYRFKFAIDTKVG